MPSLGRAGETLRALTAASVGRSPCAEGPLGYHLPTQMNEIHALRKLAWTVAVAIAATASQATAQAPVVEGASPATAADADTTVGASPGTLTASGPAAPSGPAAATTPAFGYDFFSSAAGVTDGPVDDDYLLSPRDEVVITIWGELNETMNLTVGEQGYIELPEEGGRIQANGVRLRELRPLIVRALSRVRAGYINAQDESKSTAFIDIRLGKIRPMLVNVVGEAVRPGAYGVSAAVANLINVLNLAGGVRPGGSLREVRIKRADGRVDVVDLYGFFLRGDLDARAMRLQPGDYVIVPLKMRSVTVRGEVRRPQAYELVGKEGLRELVDLAGGLAPDASVRQAQLRRTEPNVGQVVRDIDLEVLLKEGGQDLALQDQDELTIPKNVQVRRNEVTVRGEGIKRAGTYEWVPGMRLSDLVAKGGGLREHVLLDRADLVRTEDDFSKRLVSFPMKGLYERRPDGTYTLLDAKDLDFALREMDEVTIQSAWGLAGKDKSVTVSGHVKEPGKATLAQGMTLHDLLFMRGGFQDPDFAKATFMELGHLSRKIPGAVGTRMIAFDLSALLAGSPEADMTLEDGDEVRIYAHDDLTMPRQVRIDGLVRNPGSFAYSEGLSLEDLLVVAGGLRPEAVRTEAVIARRALESGAADREPSEQSTVVAVDPAYASPGRSARTPLRPFDRVTVRHLRGWEPLPVASVAGEVARPGSVTMPYAGERLTAMVARAGGLRPEAYPEGAVLRRLGGTVSMDERPGQRTSEVVIDLPAALRSPGGSEDVFMLDGDELFVPTNPGTVSVIGAVKRPMLLQHKAGRRLSEYVALCGGCLESADQARISLMAPNRATLLVGKGADPVPLAGSTVEVPLQRETERLQVVEIKGAVAKPAMVQHVEGARLGYYLTICGGTAPNADLDRIVVLLGDGSMLSPKAGEPFNPSVPAGATVVVTARPVASEGK
jgi:polysaccharide export outer membrane protein